MDRFTANDGRNIRFQVTDNYSEKPRIRHGEETIGRFLHFYNDDTGEFIKMKRIWGTYDEMQFITQIYAKEVFEKPDEE